MKKLLSVLLALTLAMSFGALSIGASATIGDGNFLSADVNLQAGHISGTGTTLDPYIFTPIAAGTALHSGDVISVAIFPTTDFYNGVARFAVMYSSAYFSIVGTGTSAFIMNNLNPFVQQAVPANGYSGATDVPLSAWPAGLQSEYDTYKAVCVSNQANANAANGGYPMLMPGNWMFSFNLTVTQDIAAGCGARIWMDNNWFKSTSNVTGAAYFTKCDSADELSTLGSSLFDFDIDLTGADLNMEPAVPPTYQITFAAAGGTGGEVQTVEQGIVPVPPVVTREGFDFLRWSPAIAAAAADTVYTAVWIPSVKIVPVEGSGIVIDNSNKLIYGLACGLSSLAGYAVPVAGCELQVVSAHGVLGTGSVVNVMLDGAIADSYTIIIFGDVNGDANITGIDAGIAVNVENYVVNWDTAADAVLIKAADVNGDGNITGIDAGIMVDTENYMRTINQSTGLAS